MQTLQIIQRVDCFGFASGDDFCIDLGYFDIVVPQEFLNDGEVIAVGEEHGGKGVPADVSGDVLVYVCNLANDL